MKLICSICGLTNFKTQGHYSAHSIKAHGVRVSGMTFDIGAVKPVNVSGRSKAQIVIDMEQHIKDLFGSYGLESPVIG